MISDWPKENEFNIDPQMGKNMEFVEEIITDVRSIRGELRLPITAKIDIIINTDKIPDELKYIITILNKTSFIIQNLTKAEKISIGSKSRPQKSAVSITNFGAEIYLPLENLIDLKKEQIRLEKEKTKIEQDLILLFKKISNQNFLNKAPEIEVNKVRQRIKEAENKKQGLENSLKRIF